MMVEMKLKIESQTVIAMIVCISAIGLVLAMWYGGLISQWRAYPDVRDIGYIVTGSIIAMYGALVIVESLFQGGKGQFPKNMSDLSPAELIGLVLGAVGIGLACMIWIQIVVPIQMLGAIAVLLAALAVWMIVAAFS